MALYIYVRVLATLLSTSAAFRCNYNESDVFLRTAIVIELDSGRYVHILNSTMDIELVDTDLTLANSINNVSKIIFSAGEIRDGSDGEYYETVLKNPMRYRVSKRQHQSFYPATLLSPDVRVCRLSFFRNNDLTDSEWEPVFEPDHKEAILQLAQSCVKSHLCNNNLLEIDVDVNRHFQSIQSSINELVDYYVPKLMANYLSKNVNRSVEMEYPCPYLPVSFCRKSLVIQGLDTIERIGDVLLSKNNASALTAQIEFRFSNLLVYSKDFDTAWTASFRTNATGAYVRSSFNVDVDDDGRCEIHLNDVTAIPRDAEEEIKFAFKFGKSYSAESGWIWNHVEWAVKRFARKPLIDCQKYLQRVSGSLSELIKSYNGKYLSDVV